MKQFLKEAIILSDTVSQLLLPAAYSTCGTWDSLLLSLGRSLVGGRSSQFYSAAHRSSIIQDSKQASPWMENIF